MAATSKLQRFLNSLGTFFLKCRWDGTADSSQGSDPQHGAGAPAAYLLSAVVAAGRCDPLPRDVIEKWEAEQDTLGVLCHADEAGNTPLHEAARNGNADLIKQLARLRPNPPPPGHLQAVLQPAGFADRESHGGAAHVLQ
jgi:hypothetical protein